MVMTYEQNKIHMKNWRKNHPEKSREYERNYKRANYTSILYYKFDSEARRLRNIRI